jgi:RNA polymerase sigma factor (sigma-70 family)
LDDELPVSMQDLLAHDGFVRDLARRLLSEDSHGAEDLAQDVWSAALERPPSQRDRVKAWLRAVALALYSNRRRKRAPQADEAIDEHARQEHTAWEQLELDTVRRSVARAVHELREPYREVVLLRFYEGLPPREVARRLRRPVQTVHTQTKRGLALIRQALQRDRKEDLSSLLLLLSLRTERSKLERLGLPAAGAVAVLGAFVALRGFLPAPAPAEAAAARPTGTTVESPQIQPIRGANAQSERAPMLAEAPSHGALASEAGVRTIQVTVRDSSGSAVPRAAVQVLLAEGWAERARTDERGQAEIEVAAAELGLGVVPSGFVYVRAEADGLATLHEASVDLGGRASARLSFDLGASSATFAGQVVDPDAIPIPAARILVLPAHVPTGTGQDGAIFRTARHETRTDEDGAFALRHLEIGRVQVFLQHPDLGLHRLEWELAADAPAAELRFAPGCIVRGTVRGVDGVPAVGADVGAILPIGLPNDWSDTATDDQGRFALPTLAGPQLHLWARAKGSFAELASELASARSGEELEWSPQLRRWPPVNVRLVDSQGIPLPSWLLYMRSETAGDPRWTATRTDAERLATLRLAVEGTLRVEIAGPLTESRKSILAVKNGVEPSDEAVHEIRIDAQPSSRGSLAARVVGRGFDLPGDLVVTLQQDGTSQYVRKPLDPREGVRFESLVAGRYRLSLSGGEALHCELASAEVAAGAAHDLGTLELGRPGELDLSLLPLDAALELWIAPQDVEPHSFWRGPGGRAEPLALLPGRYLLTSASESGARQELRFELPEDGRVAVGADFTLR